MAKKKKRRKTIIGIDDNSNYQNYKSTIKRHSPPSIHDAKYIVVNGMVVQQRSHYQDEDYWRS